MYVECFFIYVVSLCFSVMVEICRFTGRRLGRNNKKPSADMPMPTNKRNLVNNLYLYVFYRKLLHLECSRSDFKLSCKNVHWLKFDKCKICWGISLLYSIDLNMILFIPVENRTPVIIVILITMKWLFMFFSCWSVILPMKSDGNIWCFDVIQRTERAPKDRNLAEKEPGKFAAILKEKLLKVKEEQDKLDRIKENLQNLEVRQDKYEWAGDILSFKFGVYTCIYTLNRKIRCKRKLSWSYYLTSPKAH